jgi:hypothetical protein
VYVAAAFAVGAVRPEDVAAVIRLVRERRSARDVVGPSARVG